MDFLPRQKDRHIVVTGASSGIGRAIALRFASEGARLSLIARREALLEEVAADCVERGAELVQIATADVREQSSVDAAFALAHEAQGPIHGLVAASGVGGPNFAGEDDRFMEVIQTNLAGTYWCLRAAERHLAPGPDPRQMVVIASVLARFGVAGHTAYCASKSGLLGLVRALALELAPRNVAVNSVCPGWVATDMAWEGIDNLGRAIGADRDTAFKVAMKSVPLKRMSEPDDIAGLVAWLMSADALGVTGAVIDINNGSFMS